MIGFGKTIASGIIAANPRNHIHGAIAAIARPPSSGSTGSRMIALNLARKATIAASTAPSCRLCSGRLRWRMGDGAGCSWSGAGGAWTGVGNHGVGDSITPDCGSRGNPFLEALTRYFGSQGAPDAGDLG